MLENTEPEPAIDAVLHIFDQIEEALEEIAHEIAVDDGVAALREEE